MKNINLLDTESMVEGLVLMKMDIEALDPDAPKLTLNEFISSMNMDYSVFVHDGTIVPFTVMHGKADDYFVYCAAPVDSSLPKTIANSKAEKALAELESKLEAMKYDLSKLEKKTIVDMANAYGDMMSGASYFILDGEYYM